MMIVLPKGSNTRLILKTVTGRVVHAETCNVENSGYGELYLNFIEGKLYSLQTSVVNFANTGKSATYNNLRSRN